MTENLEFRVWGVRGSFPMASAEYRKYGGNTTCFSVVCGDRLVVFDAGSGLVQLGRRQELWERIGSIHIFLSHLHIDHVLGLYLFLHMADGRCPVYLYADKGQDPEKQLKTLIGEPFWPVPVEKMGVQICGISPGSDVLLTGGAGQIRIRSAVGNHPGGCLWYRLESGGSSIVTMLDCEAEGAERENMITFAKDADLLVWDASYAPGKLKKGWGHSSWEQGAALGRQAEVKRVLMTHYSWDYDDAFLESLEEQAAAADGACMFAKEGMVIRI